MFYRNKNKEGTPKTSKNKAILLIGQSEQVKQQLTPTFKILMQTHHDGVKQEIAKRKMLECVRVVEKVMLRIQTNKWKEKLVKSKRLKYLSVAEKVTLKL